MNHDSTHNHPNIDPSNVAAMLRAAADGELNAEDQARLDRHLQENPTDEARVEFDRQLRVACSRVMGPETAPASLRKRILANIQSSQTTEPEAPSERFADAIEARSGETRHQSFWTRMTPAFRAVAAAMLLLVGGVFLFQMLNITSGTFTTAQAQHMSEIASFVGQEHKTCLIDPTRASKFNITEIDSAPDLLQAIIGTSISPADLSIGGLIFRDGGRCDVPGGGQSVHLRFDVKDQPERTVSLFIQQVAKDSDNLFDAGKSYEIHSDTQPKGSQVYAWSREGLNYFLVADNRSLFESFRVASGLSKPIASDD